MTASATDALVFRPMDLAVLTAKEAIAYLRLDFGKSETAARAALDRLVNQKLLRVAKYRRERLFTRVELDRFLAARVDEYGELSG